MTTIIIKLMEFLKRFLSPNSPMSNMVIHIISYAFLGIITYLFIRCTNIFDILQIFIFSIISFAICMYISDNFKLSNYKFIRFIQLLVFIFTIFGFIALILYLLDINIFGTVFADNDDEIPATDKVSDKNNKDLIHVTTNEVDTKEFYSVTMSKKVVDTVVDKGVDLIGTTLKDVAPNLGVGFVVGKVATEAFKSTAGMAPVPRVLMVSGVAPSTAVATTIGMGLGKAVAANIKIGNQLASTSELQEIDTSPFTPSSPSSPSPSSTTSELKVFAELKVFDSSPSTPSLPSSPSCPSSPSEFDGGPGFISSVLENEDIPLIIMVNGLSYLNYIEFSLIITLFSVLFRKYLTRKLINLFLRFKKIDNINDVNISLNKRLNSLDKYSNYIFVFIFICLIWVILINIYFSSHLAENIDSYVNVYNHIKNKSLYFWLFTIND
uniref:Uncharacterized protein n=1 Tax=Lyophyllum shimeji TaxID=47721 RepID=A0A2Z4HGZ1_LYOSH|nr:hypothetical protein [Lyophyllum shimeji]AWW14109.1 hypothetical protein [Lyophyllum shimeji]